jgi:dienelactone hydrolase
VRTLMPGRAVGAIAAALAVTVLAGCTIPAPEGQAPLRYRDEVFSAVNATTDITYGQAPDLQGNPVDLKLDLYQPAGDTVAKRPAYIWVHGGGFSHGDKSSGAGVASFFARLGYVAVSINYRLLAPLGCAGHLDPSAECRAAAIEAQHDAQAAVRWLRRNAAAYRIDPDRIAMAGGSAGAITSLLVGWRPEDPGSSGNPGFSSAIRAAVSVSGGVPQDEEGVITAGDAPALFIHGMEDRAVFYSWAVSNAVKMLHLGIPGDLRADRRRGPQPPGRVRSAHPRTVQPLPLLHARPRSRGRATGVGRAGGRPPDGAAERPARGAAALIGRIFRVSRR